MNYPAKSPHLFHIPVMGTGFSIDTSLKAAKYRKNTSSFTRPNNPFEKASKLWATRAVRDCRAPEEAIYGLAMTRKGAFSTGPKRWGTRELNLRMSLRLAFQAGAEGTIEVIMRWIGLDETTFGHETLIVELGGGIDLEIVMLQ